jgi:hypothetical protein
MVAQLDQRVGRDYRVSNDLLKLSISLHFVDGLSTFNTWNSECFEVDVMLSCLGTLNNLDSNVRSAHLPRALRNGGPP